MSHTLQVTGCRVYLNQGEDEHLKGFASVILNDEFAVCDLKIIQGHKGLFVAMPSRRRRDGTFHDVAHPITHELREHIEQVVLGEYQQQTTGSFRSEALSDSHRDGHADGRDGQESLCDDGRTEGLSGGQSLGKQHHPANSL